MSKTSLSVGLIVSELLLASEEVTAITSSVFPIAVDEQKLPYICYNRQGVAVDYSKGGANTYSHDTATISVMCCSESYAESIELAEAVRGALECKAYSTDDLITGLINMVDASETYAGDAFVQTLTFTIKI